MRIETYMSPRFILLRLPYTALMSSFTRWWRLPPVKSDSLTETQSKTIGHLHGHSHMYCLVNQGVVACTKDSRYGK